MLLSKDKVLEYYSQNETKINISFFIGGIIFDVFTLSDIDSLSSIIQQIIYIIGVGLLLYYDFLDRHNLLSIQSEKIKKLWQYRDVAIHFLMGGVLNLYSLFFLKSSSFMASFVFLGFMLAMIIANELKIVQENKINLKIALYFICIFSFFALIYPLFLGFVGWLPFSMAFISTALVIYLVYKLLVRKINDSKILSRALLLPGLSIINLFLLFYCLGWIPPVPISVNEIGIYHNIEKTGDGDYILYSEKPWWKFWESGDQEFMAEPGDSVFLFVRIFSPARFNDSVTLHWQLYDKKRGWQTTDQIKMQIMGGRREGYRGYAFKQKYQDGDWRVLVETNDGHEIGRQNFKIMQTSESSEDRVFEREIR
jgi:hypothetical protein